MLKRVITGAGYVVVMVAFFLLRELVDARIFHLLTYFLIVAGAAEAGRMLRPFTVKGTFTLSVVTASLFVPIYLVSDYFFSGWGFLFALDFIAVVLIGVCV